MQLVSCISTGEKETVSYQRKPSEVVFSAEGDSLMSYGHHVSMQNDQLHLLLTYFGHNEGSSSTDAYYSYDISNQSFQIVDTKSSKSPVMTSNGGIAQEPYPIYVPFAPLLGGKPLSTDTVNADAELVAKDKAALIDDRYIDKDETIVDIEMGLEWKKCSEGQTGQQCAGLGSAYMWTDAMQLASESNFAGYDDWRLPTSTELRSLRYCDYDSEKHLSNTNSPGCDWLKGGERTKNYKKPTIRQKLFPNTQYGKKDSWYWSSSDGETTGESAIVVNFNDGYYPFESKHEYGFIRLVRKADLPIGQ